MNSLQVAIVCVACALLCIYWLAYRWARKTLGERDLGPIPSARVQLDGRHRGFRHEPAWLRSLQSAILAFGITGISASALGFVAFVGIALFR